MERFKHFPPAWLGWHEFLALLGRRERFEWRERLIMQESMILSNGPAKGLEGQHGLMLRKVRTFAWPTGG